MADKLNLVTLKKEIEDDTFDLEDVWDNTTKTKVLNSIYSILIAIDNMTRRR